MKPLLLVDVDGVLNAFGTWADPSVSVKTEMRFEANGASSRERASGQHRYYTINVPVGTTKRLNYLTTLFECVWATTWEHLAGTELSPMLGVGADWPVIEVMKGRDSPQLPNGRWSQTWKLPEVWRWCEENAGDRKVAWIDDDLSEDAMDWAVGNGYHLQRIAPSTGLTKLDVRALKGYACGD